MYKLQGLSEGMVDRLLDQGIESAAQLATADPIKLLLRTNIEWKTILDVIDEAILFNYFGDKIEKLRPFGIRGAIELASIQHRLVGNEASAREEAQALVGRIAEVLEVPEPATTNAIQNAWEDVQVDFLWSLWGDTDPGRDEEDRSRAESHSAANTELPPTPED